MHKEYKNSIMCRENIMDAMNLIKKTTIFIAFVFVGVCLSDNITVKAEKSKTVTIDAQPDTSDDSGENGKNGTETVIDAKTETTETSTQTANEGDDTSEIGDDADGSGWNKNKNSYYEDGEKVTGWKSIEGKLYFFNKKGKLYTKTGLRTIGEKTYYFDDEHYVLSGVIEDDGKSYYFKKKGGARFEEPGVVKIDGKYYCVKEDCSLKKGWHKDTDGMRYYFNKKTYEGLTGWNYVGKYKFYFDNKARLVQDVRDELTKKQKKTYKIRVNRSASCVTVYAKDGAKGYTIPVVAFVCSAGKDTPTGKFNIKDKLRWHELMGPCWGQWCMHLTTDILFHSVYYNNERDNKSLNTGAYKRLGTMASHGCVRLAAGDCKWIYDNCKVGTKVEIYNSKKNPGPFDKPEAVKLKAGQTWDPTDPTIG